MRLWVLSLIVLASLIGLNKAEPFTLSLEPRILKVCQGCRYESIQEAIDAASPGDVIEVYPMFYNPVVAYYPTAVIISKPLTLVRRNPFLLGRSYSYQKSFQNNLAAASV